MGRKLLRDWTWWLAPLWLLISAAAVAMDDAARLAADYRRLQPQLTDNPYHAPIHILSEERGDWLRGEVFGVIDQPYERSADALATPRAWCEILFLHPNVKACLVEPRDGAGLIRLYMGRKHFQPPEEAYLATTRFQVPSRANGHLRVNAEAGEGPFGLEGYTITLEAIPIEGARTFVHFAYAVRYGTITRLALKAYFATLGHAKVGFSRDPDGEPIRGTRGMIERNAMRNYLAVIAYLDGPDAPLERRLKQWFDGSERYPRQLRESDWPEYLEQKLQERRAALAFARAQPPRKPP